MRACAPQCNNYIVINVKQILVLFCAHQATNHNHKVLKSGEMI